MKLKLTDALIERRKSPETGREEIFDTLVPGFGIRIGQRERAFFFIRRIRGEKVRFSLGQYPAISLHKARTEALEIVDKIKRGIGSANGGETTYLYRDLLSCHTQIHKLKEL